MSLVDHYDGLNNEFATRQFKLGLRNIELETNVFNIKSCFEPRNNCNGLMTMRKLLFFTYNISLDVLLKCATWLNGSMLSLCIVVYYDMIHMIIRIEFNIGIQYD